MDLLSKDENPDLPLYLGLDTGGTYTDSVLWSPQSGIIAKAKALTTRHDLSIGIAEAAGRVLVEAKISPSAIKLVSMSTTLATNALVEGQGGRIALIMIGFTETELEREGLRQALGTDPVLFLPGGHDVHGNATELDLSLLEDRLEALGQEVTGFAICAYFATRNASHELIVRDLIRAHTGLPVTSSHELTSQLGGPRRALTTLLNARLIGMIERLIDATGQFLEASNIIAPLMVVRGDGALVSAQFARERPIETILSGPAASLVGAHYLTGQDNAIISDIGGTTTDIAVLDQGRPRLDPEGAKVGPYRTMVEAVAMRTFGLGGDSQVGLKTGGLEARFELGPRRYLPLALSAVRHGPQVIAVLERQLRAANAGRMDGLLAIRTGLAERHSAGLKPAELKLYQQIGEVPVALDDILMGNAQMIALNRLVSRGLVHIIGFTPSDAAHILGLQDNWNREASILGGRLFARRRDGRGQILVEDEIGLARKVLHAVTRRSAEIMLETVFDEDGLNGAELVENPLVQNALDAKGTIASLSLGLKHQVIGLGASAALHYKHLDQFLGQSCLVPPDADVANALGAVVGQVRVAVEVHVSQPEEGLYRVALGGVQADFDNENSALIKARDMARIEVAIRAKAAGTDNAELVLDDDIRAASVEGHRSFIEAIITATATGRPRIAVS